MDLRKLFGIEKRDERKRGEMGTLFAEIEPLLTGHGEDEIKLITGLAGLLGTVTYADMEMSSVEREQTGTILSARLQLPAEQVTTIQELLRVHRVRLFALEDHVYARLINSVTDRAQRMDLMRLLFALAAADHAISSSEEAALRQVADALKLSHREYVTVRSDFSKFRDVFKT